MADTKITISAEILDNISTSLNKITKNIENFGKTSESTFNKTANGVTAISTGFLAVTKAVDIASKSLNILTGIIKEGIKQAAEYEKAEALLVSTLRQRGLLTKEILNSNLALADSLSKLTTFQDEEILQVERLLLQYGVQQSQLKEVTKATLDFAVATGKDLSTAAQLVGKSIGTNTNALGRYGIELKGVSGSTSRAVEAIRALNQSFGGTAVASANTFSGSIKQLNNQIDDTYKAFGQAFVQNTAVIGAIKLINEAFIKLQIYIEKNKESIMSLVKDGIVFLIKSLGTLLEISSFVINVFSEMANPIDILILLFAELTASLLKFVNIFVKLGDKLGFSTKLGDSLKSFQSELEGVSQEAQKSIMKPNDALIKFSEYSKIASQSAKDLANNIEKIPAQKTIDIKQKINIENAALSFTDIMIKGAYEIKDSLLNAFKSLDIKSAFGFLTGGKGGGEKLMTDMTKKIGTAIGGPAGGQIGEILSIFGKDTKEFQTMVDGFIKAVVDFPINIAKNIPYLIQAIINAIPELIESINEMLPLLIESLVNMISDPKFWESVIKAAINVIALLLGNPMFWINIAMAFIRALIQGIPAIIVAFVQGIGNSIGKAFANIGKFFSDAANIFKGAVDFFKSIVDGLKNVVGGGLFKKAGGGIVSGFKKVGKIFGLQEGGSVPRGFNSDTFGPVTLSSGENVMDYSLNRRMSSFLDKQENQPQNLTVNLQVGEKDLASVMLSLKQRGFRTA